MSNDKPRTAVTEVTGLERGAEEERSLGQRIRDFRQYLGLTQEGLGSLIGDINQATVNRWERDVVKPQHRPFSRMLEIAREQGGLRQLVGTDERELMIARLHSQAPSDGVAVFLDFAITDPDDLGSVIGEICKLGARPNKFVALGDNPDQPKTEALFLVQVSDYETVTAIVEYLRTSELVQDPHVRIESRSDLELSVDRATGRSR